MAIGLLNLIGRGAKRAISSKYFPAVAGTAAVGGAAVAGGAKSGVIQFDPWGEKKEAYERDLGEKFIKQEAFDRSKAEQQEAYQRSKGKKDQFGYGTVELRDSDWIPFKQGGKKYVFANIPEVQEVMQSGNILNMQGIFDDLLDKGYIKKV
jgi:hypothetical protein